MKDKTRVLSTMSKLINAPYRRGRDNQTKMPVGCIKMNLGSIKMLIHFHIIIVTLVTLLVALRPK
jgi:hypothetical protein